MPFTTTSRRVAVIAAAVVVAGGGAVVAGNSRHDPGQPPAPTQQPGTANIWVDTNGGTCADNASSVSYNDAAACATFDAASDTCENGDTVLVRNGSYGDQTITGSNSRTAACSISAENTASDSVTFGTLTTDGDWLTIQHMDSHAGETTHAGNGGCFWCSKEGGSHILLDDVNLWGKWADGEISGGSVHATATDVTWTHSHLGTSGNTADRLCGQDDEPFRISEAANIVVSYNTFHSFRGETNAGNCGGGTYHLEVFRVWDTTDGFTLLSNYFEDGDGSDSPTISSDQGGCGACPDNTNVRIVNNYFGNKCCNYSNDDVGFPGHHGTCTGWVFAYNFFHDDSAGMAAAGISPRCTTGAPVIVGNIGFGGGGCPGDFGSGVGTFTRNVWLAPTAGSCAGNTYLTGAYGADAGGTLANYSAYGLTDAYHISSGSALVNAGENTLCQQYTGGLDIDGDPRNDGTCDAGPDEYSGG